MNWLIFVAIAVVLDSTRIFIDNYVSDVYFRGREAVSQKLFFGYFFLAAGVILAAVLGFDFDSAYAVNFALFFVSGMIGSLAGIPYYRALELDNSTNIGIFIQLAPVLYLVLGWAFLGESFSLVQLLAFIVILSAPTLIILTTRKRSRKVKIKAALYASLYVLIAVIGNLIFVKENTAELAFLAEMVFVFLGRGVGNLIIMYARPRWRRRFIGVAKKSRGKVFRPLTVDGVIGVVKDVAYRFALTAAPAVALASATSDSAEPIAIFFLGLVFTLISPKFGREKLTRKTVLVHLIATVLVVVGIVILQF